MKNVTTLLATALIAVCSLAQAPNKFSYQAVIRNSSGNLVTNAGVGLKISILYGSPSGPASYSEIYNPNPQTNANGLVNLQIGSGIALIGQLDTINWASGPYFLKTETDPTGGTTYSILGTSELSSVPYALHAANGNWTKIGNDISSSNSGNVGIGIANPIFKLDVIGNSRITSGVSGYNTAPYIAGVYGESSAPDHDYGVYGKCNTTTGIAVYGYAPSGTAGYFSGKVSIDAGNLNVSSGWVGIGTSTPICPMDIRDPNFTILNPAAGTCGGTHAFIECNGPQLVADGTARTVSLHTDHAIWAGWGVVSTSDQRIKKDFILSDNEKDLIKLKELKVTDFKYKDEMKYGSDFKKGFIAQEVKQSFPQAVSTQIDFITDIFSFPDKTELVNGNLVITMKSTHGICDGDFVRLITGSGNLDISVEVNNDYVFTVKNWCAKDNKVFVYGKKVNDFLTVDYDRIFTLNVSATQELIKKVDALERENAALKQLFSSELEQLRSEIQGLKNPPALQVQK